MTASRIVASANACARGSSPGRPSRRAIAIGSVSRPARVRNVVAPNSPSEIAAAKPAPASNGRAMRARRRPSHARSGEAPSVAAAARRSVGIARSTGTKRAHDERRSPRGRARAGSATTRHASRTGATSNVISIPSPIVTADVPSGSIVPTSSNRPLRRAVVIASAASRAGERWRARRRRRRSAARSSSDAHASTPRLSPGDGPRRCRASRHAASDQPSPSWNDRRTSATSGADPSRRRSPRTCRRPSRRCAAACAALAARLHRSSASAARRCDTGRHGDEHGEHERAAAPTAPRRRRRRRAAWRGVRSRPRASGSPAPPSSTTTPNDVNVNRKTTSAGGPQRWPQQRQRRRDGAPAAARHRACAPRRSGRAGSPPTSPPTMRTTTARLKNTCATTTARAVPCQPSGQQRHERRADHDRRQHERHGDDRQHCVADRGTGSGPARRPGTSPSGERQHRAGDRLPAA